MSIGTDERVPLGRMLCDTGSLAPRDLARARALQRHLPYRLGEVLAARGLSSPEAVSGALGRQRGLGFVDLDRDPPDPGLLRAGDAARYLSLGILPWRRIGRVTTYAVLDPGRASLGLARLHGPGRYRPGLCCVVLATRPALERAVARALGPALADRAAVRPAEEDSVRSLGRLRRACVLGFLAALGLLAALGEAGILLGLVLLCLVNAATTLLRVAALLAGRRLDDGTDAPLALPPPRRDGALPMVSLLVPLYREAHMLPQIVAALSRLDYPRERLEVRLLLEEDDLATRAAAEAADLPAWIAPLVVPGGRPRTKPRAMNYALDFCRGEVIGILDAEDHPAPDQLRAVVGTLADSPRRVACVQCQLSYHNATENWLSRCFFLEYAIWFDVLLRGFQALGLPIPLGGTSVYFRRQALVEVGGWDAHNVTEDADLGMRLHRRGWRTAVLRSVTLEEANCRAGPWVRQRSRWLKGYLITWIGHMRDPKRLWRELGPRGFLGLNLLFGGAAAAYLAMPLFWASTLAWLFTGSTAWHGQVSPWVLAPILASLASGQAVMLACAVLALGRRRMPGLLWWVPTLPLYWTLGALAAWKAVAELAVAPFWWDKTHHGVSSQYLPGPQPRRGAMRVTWPILRPGRASDLP